LRARALLGYAVVRVMERRRFATNREHSWCGNFESLRS
jgi:hypothetical protein